MKHIFDEYYISHHQVSFNDEIERCLEMDRHDIGFFCVDCTAMVVNDYPWHERILSAKHSWKIEQIKKERELYGS